MNVSPCATPRWGGRPRAQARGFTMIEIALCLGVIAVALVAIIGVMPTGLRVQQDNRRDTLLTQDGMLFLDAIRSGREVGNLLDPVASRAPDWPNSLDYLTNHVVAVGITNDFDGGAIIYVNPHLYTGPLNTDAFPLFGRIRPNWGSVQLRPILTNGLHIVGLLSRPKWETRFNGTEEITVTNYVAALVRSISGSASERGRTAIDPNFSWGNFAFTYVVASEVVPLDQTAPQWVDYNQAGLTLQERADRYGRFLKAMNQYGNFREVRLLLSGPVTQVRREGVRRWESPGNPRILRTVVGGREFAYQVANDPLFTVNYFLPGSYVRMAK